MLTRSEQSDLELLDGWIQGSNRDGSLLLSRHFNTLHRFFATKLPNHCGVEDLIQQTMLACTKSRDKFRKESSFRTYLLAIARNELYQQFRRQQRQRALFDPLSHSVQDLATSPSAIVAKKSELDSLLDALRTLPLELQSILELHYWEHMGTRELALVFDIPHGTVKSRIRKGKQVLKAALTSNAFVSRETGHNPETIDEWMPKFVPASLSKP